jgi:hypothetical protein
VSGAQRFGGAYSPGAQPGRGRPPVKWSERAIRSPSLRALGLFAAPSLLLFGMLGALGRGDGIGLVWLGAAYLLIVAGASLTRTGLTAEAAYEARAVARPPGFPRKLFGAVAIALGVGLCALRATASPLQAAIFAAIAAGLHLAAFGLDPMRSKGLDGLDTEALDAAITRIDTAKALIADMRQAAAKFGEQALADQVERLAATATEVLAKIERDPRELRRARRFLAVYLVGARDATVQFAQSFDASGDPAIRDKYAALLTDLEAQFASHRDTLLQDNRTALDVEIDVLRERLKQEGV